MADQVRQQGGQAVARHGGGPAEVQLQQVGEDDAQHRGADGEFVELHHIAQNAEGDHPVDVHDGIVDGERAHHGQDDDDGH